MIGKLLSILRDIALFYILFILLNVAFKDTVSYVLEHKQSLIHELDRHFIDHLYTAQRQLHNLEEHPVYADTYITTITDLKNRLTTIEEQYKKNSPGLALLGPIGTASIVTKEEHLQKKLLIIINDMGNLLHKMTDTTEPFEPVSSIQSGLQTNKQCLKLLLT